MWKTFFVICDILCYLIPNRAKQLYIRQHLLFDWKEKYKTLKQVYPNLCLRNIKIIRGGWNIGFIVDNKYVFKIAKFYDETRTINKVTREKRITDAFRNTVKIKIPKIVIIKTPKFVFYRYDFIAGKNLNHLPMRIIKKYRDRFAPEIAKFIYAVHNTNPIEINDLKGTNGDGWNHNDICNNVIVDTKTYKIAGIIDWEYARYGALETEFNNCVRFSSKLRKSGILEKIKKEYYKQAQNK